MPPYCAAASLAWCSAQPVSLFDCRKWMVSQSVSRVVSSCSIAWGKRSNRFSSGGKRLKGFIALHEWCCFNPVHYLYFFAEFNLVYMGKDVAHCCLWSKAGLLDEFVAAGHPLAQSVIPARKEWTHPGPSQFYILCFFLCFFFFPLQINWMSFQNKSAFLILTLHSKHVLIESRSVTIQSEISSK